MKIPHKVNHGYTSDRTDPRWAERVEREAEVTTAQAEREYAKAAERLARAEAKAQGEERKPKPDRKRVARLWAVVVARREELLALQRLTQASPAGAQNRGKGAHRGVPGTQAM